MSSLFSEIQLQDINVQGTAEFQEIDVGIVKTDSVIGSSADQNGNTTLNLGADNHTATINIGTGSNNTTINIGNTTDEVNINGARFTSNAQIVGTLSGNASTTTKLASGKSIALSGDVSGSVTFDGSQDVTITSTIGDGKVTNAMLSGSIADSKLNQISTSGKVANSATTATSSNIASAIVARDASGNFSAGIITADLTGNVTGNLTGNVTGNLTGNVTGNVDTATKLGTARSIALSGDISGTVSFDGSQDVSISSTIGAGKVTNSMLAGSIADSKLNQITSSGKVANSATTATASNTASAIVSRDASGNFSANVITALLTGNVTGNVTGNADTATVLSNTRSIALSGDITGSASFNGSTDATISSTIGAGKVTNSMLAGSIADSKLNQITSSGKIANSATTASSSNTASAIVTRDVSGNFSAGIITADLSGNVTGNVTGNTDTSTKLATARTVSLSGDITGSALFDGSADATISSTIGAGKVTNSMLAGSIANNKLATASDSNTASSVMLRDANKATHLSTLYTDAIEPETTNVSGNQTLNIATSDLTGTKTVNIATSNSVETVNIGSNNSTGITTINIGAPGDKVYIAGDVTKVNATDMMISDSVITIGDGNISGSNAGYGLEIVKNATTKGYVKVNGSGNGFSLSADGTNVIGLNQSLTTTDNVSFGTVTASLSGNASTATKLSSTRTIALTGDVTGSVSSDLLSGASVTTSIASGAVTNAMLSGSIDDTKLNQISTSGKVANSATTATNSNTASAIVSRDASGNFSANIITASLSGNASTATKLATARNVALSGDVTGTVSFDGSADATISSTIGAGKVTNTMLSGSIASSKLADAPTSANTVGKIVLRDASGNFSAGTVTANLTGNVTGNASTATKLATARNVALSGDVTGTASFDGSADATITSTISGLAVSKLANGTANQVLVSGASNPAWNSNLIIDSNGYLGLGAPSVTEGRITMKEVTATTTPSYTSTNGLATVTLWYDNVNQTGGFSGTRYQRVMDIVAAGTNDGTAGGACMRFLTTDVSGSPTERMRIDRTGNVGIGTTAPIYKLQIDGSSNGGTTPAASETLLYLERPYVSGQSYNTGVQHRVSKYKTGNNSSTQYDLLLANHADSGNVTTSVVTSSTSNTNTLTRTIAGDPTSRVVTYTLGSVVNSPMGMVNSNTILSKYYTTLNSASLTFTYTSSSVGGTSPAAQLFIYDRYGAKQGTALATLTIPQSTSTTITAADVKTQFSALSYNAYPITIRLELTTNNSTISTSSVSVTITSLSIVLNATRIENSNIMTLQSEDCRIGILNNSPLSTLTIGNNVSDVTSARSTLTLAGASPSPEYISRPGLYHRSNVGLGVFSDASMSFEVYGSSGTLTEAMRIDYTGKIGLGTVPNAFSTTVGYSGSNNSTTTPNKNFGLEIYNSYGGTSNEVPNLIAFTDYNSIQGAIGGYRQNYNAHYLGGLAFYIGSQPAGYTQSRPGTTTTASGSLTEAMRVTPAGLVGIGTTTPTAKLDVTGLGGANNDTTLAISNLTNSNCTFSITGHQLGASSAITQKSAASSDLSLQFYNMTPYASYASGTTATFTFLQKNSSGGISNSLYITRDCNVGIATNLGVGTSSPNANLHIASSSSNASQNVLRFATPNLGVATECAYKIGFGCDAFGTSDMSAGIGFIRKSAAYNNQSAVAFYTYNGAGSGSDLTSERMRIDSNGNIGIATNAPLSLLSLGNPYSTSTYTADYTNKISFMSNLYTLNSGGNVTADTTYGTKIGHSITFVPASYNDVGNGIAAWHGKLLFNFENSGGTGNTPLTLTSNNRVGINTTSPMAALHIKNNTVSTTSNGILLQGNMNNSSTLTRPALNASSIGPYEIRGASVDGVTSDDGFLRLSAGGGNAVGAQSFIDLSGYNASSSNDMYCNIRMGTAGTERMRIDSNGKVGFGVSSLTYPFEFSSASPVSATMTGGYYMNNTTTASSITNGSGFGITMKCSGYIWATTGIIASSDARIKTNIAPARDCLDIACKIQVKNYNYIDKVKGDHYAYGVIAQEVKEVFPEAVTVAKDYIPSIYKLATSVANSESNITITLDVQHNLTSEDNIRLIIQDNDKYVDTKVVSVVNDYTFVVNIDYTEGKSIFVFGKEVNDFLTVDKTRLSTLAIGAVKELKAEHDQLVQDNTDLIAVVQQQQATIDNLQQQLANVLSILQRNNLN